MRGLAAALAGEQGDTLQRMVTDRLSFQAEDDASDEELGGGFGNPARRSGESAGDAARSRRTSTTQSRRSSFALERASFEANRSSLEMFGVQAAARHLAPVLPPVRHKFNRLQPVHEPGSCSRAGRCSGTGRVLDAIECFCSGQGEAVI